MKPVKITYEGVDRVVLVGNTQLKSQLGSKELEYVNAKNETKQYKLATVAVDFGNGNTTEMLASVPKKIYDSNTFEVNEKYLTTIEKVEDKNKPGSYILLARLSALRTADINQKAVDFAINNLFELDEAETPVEQAAPAITA